MVNFVARANQVIDVEASQGQAQDMQDMHDMQVIEALGRQAEAVVMEIVAQASAPVRMEGGGAPTTPSNKREAPEQASPPKVLRSQSSQEPTNSAFMSMLQLMMNQQNSVQAETKHILENLHSRAEAADQRVGALEQAVETTYSQLEARTEKCEAMDNAAIADRFDDMVKNIDEGDKERDKKLKVSEDARHAAQRKLEHGATLGDLGGGSEGGVERSNGGTGDGRAGGYGSGTSIGCQTTADNGGRNPHMCAC